MKEQLISFETAKLAKEKGCELDLYHETDWTYFENGDEFICNYDPRKKHLEAIQVVVCTQSLLQKWLRDIHMIYTYVIINQAGIYVEIFDPNNKEHNITLGEDGGYETYEDALEAGLQVALKQL